LTLDDELRLEDICRRFESAWKENRHPRIEDHLVPEPAALRTALAGELLALEITYRLHNQEQPRAEDYRQRFPDFDVQQIIDRAQGRRSTAAQGTAIEPSAEVVLGAIPGLEIGAQISRGGMGTVYKAYQPALDRVVALKTVRPELLTRSGLELFKREAKLLASSVIPTSSRFWSFSRQARCPTFSWTMSSLNPPIVIKGVFTG
jgi:hypothetical protein